MPSCLSDAPDSFGFRKSALGACCSRYFLSRSLSLAYFSSLICFCASIVSLLCSASSAALCLAASLSRLRSASSSAAC